MTRCSELQSGSHHRSANLATAENTTCWRQLQLNPRIGRRKPCADDRRFVPQDTTIAAGLTVCWQNQGTESHTVTSDDGTSFNGTLEPRTFLCAQVLVGGKFPVPLRRLDKGLSR